MIITAASLALALLTSQPHSQPSHSQSQPRAQSSVVGPSGRLVPPASPPLDVATALALDLPSIRAQASQGEVRLTDLPLGPARQASLVLRSAATLRPEVRLASRQSDGSMTERALASPGLTVLRGGVEGEAGSLAVLGVRDDGIQGFVRSQDRVWVISSGRFGRGGTPISYELDAAAVESLGITVPTCAAESLDGYAEAAAAAAGAVAGGGANGVAGAPPCRVVQVGLETDLEFTVNLFDGDEDAAADYAYFLLAAVSELYREQLNVRIEVNFLRLWTSTDIWDGGSTSAQLGQFKDVWGIAMSWLDRDLSHFLSGRPLGGGIAYLSAICSSDIGYGVSANLNGTFPYPIQDHASQNWDLMVVAHELGHNFGAPHTHNYNPPLDGCGNGDCSQAWGGTIMSYCHQCPGGIANMVMSFHPENVATMLAFLEGIDCPASGEEASVQHDAAEAAGSMPVTIDVLANDFRVDCDAPSLLSFDASGAGGGSIALAPGAGADGRDALTYTAPEGFEGFDTFGYVASLGNGAMQSGTVEVHVQAIKPAIGGSGLLPGLQAAYYGLVDPVVLPNFDLLQPSNGEVVGKVDFASTGGAFAGSGKSDNVGAVFTGFLNAPNPGLYTLFLESDDGSRLFIGEELVVDNDGLHGMVEQSGLVALAEGWHPLRIEFFERGGGAGLIARMTGPGVLKQVIPAYRLAHGLPGDLDGDGAVAGSDLGQLLAAWGTSSAGGAAGPADLNGDGVVDGSDLGILLAAWSGN